MARMGFIDRWSRVLYGAFFVSALATLRRRVSPRAVATSEAVRAPTLLWASRVGCCTKAGRVMNRGHGETDAEIPALGRGAARLWTSYCPPGRGRATRPAGTSRRKKRAGSSSPRAAVRRTPPGLSVVAAPVASECLELLPQRRGRLSGRGMGRTTPKERRGYRGIYRQLRLPAERVSRRSACASPTSVVPTAVPVPSPTASANITMAASGGVGSRSSRSPAKVRNGLHTFVTTSVTTGTDGMGSPRTPVEATHSVTCINGRRRTTTDRPVATENRGVGSSILPLATRPA